MKDLCKKLHKHLHKKLHNSKGETLMEVLVSVLVCTISVALLFSAIMAAANINQKAEISDEGFFNELNLAEEKIDSKEYKSGKVFVKEDGGTEQGVISIQFDVNYYGNETIHSYKLAPKTSIPGGEGGGTQ